MTLQIKRNASITNTNLPVASVSTDEISIFNLAQLTLWLSADPNLAYKTAASDVEASMLLAERSANQNMLQPNSTISQAAHRPAFITGSHGKPALRFGSGSNGSFTLTTALNGSMHLVNDPSVLGTGSYTFAFVARIPTSAETPGTGGPILMNQEPSGANKQFRIGVNAGSGVLEVFHSHDTTPVDYTVGVDYRDSTWHLFLVSYDFTAKRLRIRTNGAQIRNTVITEDRQTTTAARQALIGAGFGPTSLLTPRLVGQLSEGIFLSGIALAETGNSATLTLVEGYLMGKYGLT